MIEAGPRPLPGGNVKIKRVAPYAALGATGVLVATAFAGMAALGAGSTEIPTRDEAPAVVQVGDATSVPTTTSETNAEPTTRETSETTDAPATTTTTEPVVVEPAPPVTQTPEPPVQVRTEVNEPEQPPVEEEPAPEPEPEQPPTTTPTTPPEEDPPLGRPGLCWSENQGMNVPCEDWDG